MYKALLTAGKRLFDQTLGPMLLAAIMTLFEVGLGLVTWVLIKIADFLIFLMGKLINAIPFPDDVDPFDGFTGKTLDLLEITGVWPALAVYFTLAISCLVSRILTVGIVGRS